MPYAFKQIFAEDVSAPEKVASYGYVTIFAPGDSKRTPLTLTTLDGLPLANPVQVNELGFGPPFMHATLPQVAWTGGGLNGTFESYEGMRDEAVAARQGAEEAAAEAQAPTDLSVDRGIARADIPGKVAEQISNGPIMAGVVADYIRDPNNEVYSALGTFTREVRPEAYGARGGAADDTNALRLALAAAAGGKLVISQEHRLNGALVPSLAKPTAIELRPGAALVQYGNFNTIMHVGSAGGDIAITAGASLGSTTITLASVTGLAVKDTLMVYSNNVMPNDPTATEAMLRTVRSIDGLVVTLDAALYVGLTSSPRVKKVSLAPPVTITGPGEIRHSAPDSVTKALLYFTFAEEPSVSATLRDNGGPGLQVTSCLGGEFTGHIRDLLDDSAGGHYGYGINAAGCTRGFRLHSGSATRVRHAFTTGSAPGLGGPENCHVEPSFIVRDTFNAGLDTHAPGFGNVLHANTTGCAIGVQDRARNTRILGHVDSSTLYGVNVTDEARDTVVDVFLSGMKSGAAGGVAIRTPNVRLTLDVAGLPSNVPAVNASEDYFYDGTLPLTGTGKPLRTLARLDTEMTFPADRLIATGGTPDRMTTTFFWPSWALGHGTNESVGVVVRTPFNWNGRYQVVVRAVNLTGSTDPQAGAAALRMWSTYKSPGDSLLSGVSVSEVTAVTAGQRGILQEFVLGEVTIAPNETRPLLLKVERRGLEAADTLSVDFGIESITLRKVV